MMYLKSIITTLVILFTSVSSLAQHTSNPASSSFRIWRRNSNGVVSGGSATAIDDHLVVTNVHVVGRVSQRQTVEVKHPLTNKSYKGLVVGSWPEPDVALVAVTEARLPWSKMGPNPKTGEKLTLFGYGSDSVLKSGNGTVLSGPRMYRDGKVPVITTAWETSVQSVSGDSGGGLFNSKGELVAINWGAESGNQNSVSTPVSYIRGLACYWVTSKLPQERWKEFDFSQYCQPGMPCQPIPYGGPSRPPYGGGGKEPVQPIPMEPIPPDPDTPIQKPDPPTPPTVDYDKIVAMVYKKIEKEIYVKIEKDFRERYEKTEKELIEKSEKIYERIETIERGKDGKDGKNGDNGKDAVVDYDKLTTLIYEKMQENPDKWKGEDGEDGKDVNLDDLSFNVQFQTLDNRGNVVSSGNPIEIPMGGTLIIPPQMLRIRKGDRMFTVGAELGSPMRLQNIPRSKK